MRKSQDPGMRGGTARAFRSAARPGAVGGGKDAATSGLLLVRSATECNSAENPPSLPIKMYHRGRPLFNSSFESAESRISTHLENFWDRQNHPPPPEGWGQRGAHAHHLVHAHHRSPCHAQPFILAMASAGRLPMNQYVSALPL